MECVKTYQVSCDLCDLINSRINVPVGQDTHCSVETDITELYSEIDGFCKDFYISNSEFNYFAKPSAIKMNFKMWINYVPPWTCMQWTHEEGDTFNCYVFLRDSKSIVEIFDPFIKKSVKVPVRKGLVILVPAVWFFTRRHTSTLESDALFVMVAVRVNNFDDV